MSKKVLYFTDPQRCNPCRRMEPIVQDLVTTKSMEIEKVDMTTEAGRNLTMSLQITAIPTFVFVDSERVVKHKVSGVQAPEKLFDMYNSMD